MLHPAISNSLPGHRSEHGSCSRELDCFRRSRTRCPPLACSPVLPPALPGLLSSCSHVPEGEWQVWTPNSLFQPWNKEQDLVSASQLWAWATRSCTTVLHPFNQSSHRVLSLAPTESWLPALPSPHFSQKRVSQYSLGGFIKKLPGNLISFLVFK